MTIPYVEYTDEDGNKSKLELETGVESSAIEKFYNDYIKKHDSNAPFSR